MDPNQSIAGIHYPEVVTVQTSIVKAKPVLHTLLSNQQTESSTTDQDILAVSTNISIICYFIYVGEMCIYYWVICFLVMGIILVFWLNSGFRSIITITTTQSYKCTPPYYANISFWILLGTTVT